MKDLSELRVELDDVDRRLADLLAERWEIVKQVGPAKLREGLDGYDPEREHEVVDGVVRRATERGVPSRVARHVIGTLVVLCRKEVERHVEARDPDSP